MSHHLYQTEGFVLGSSPYGEANKYFLIFTEDLGLVRASAQSVRSLQSKLRFVLQDFAYIKVVLVKGKDSWRITTVLPISKLNGDAMRIFARTVSLLNRLLHGEEKNSTLFSHIREAYLFLQNPSFSKELLANFEYILVLRILHSLGYVGNSPDLEQFVISPYWSEDLLQKISSVKRVAIDEINRSLKESQL